MLEMERWNMQIIVSARGIRQLLCEVAAIIYHPCTRTLQMCNVSVAL